LADIIFILLPDELQKSVYEKHIEPNLEEGKVLVFAHGYNIAFELIKPPKNVDILLIAPRMIGIGVRECVLSGEGYFSFIGVHQNGSGRGKERLLALCKAVGALSKAGIEVSFKQETILDLFTEQGFGPASSQIMMKPIDLLIEKGYPEEAVLVEFILSGNMKYTIQAMLNVGIIDQIGLLHDREQFGLLTRGLRYKHAITEILTIQKGILKHIESRGFTKEWERLVTKLKFKFIKFMASRVGIGPLERRVRKKLHFQVVDLWAETPYPTSEEIAETQKRKQELADFYRYPEF
jgi:ketol-acid reductoisomerase